MRRALQALVLLGILLLLAAGVAPAGHACFGPKLYLGTEERPEHDILFALVSLYVKEKTGTETVRVDLAGEDPLGAIAEERVDMALLPRQGGVEGVVLALEGAPVLVAGPRPRKDLQFTTVVPALEKLGGLVRPADLRDLASRVSAGRPPLAAVRELLMARGWI